MIPIIYTFLHMSAFFTDRHMDFRVGFSMGAGDISHVLTFFAYLVVDRNPLNMLFSVFPEK